jgi:hypothetical protein
MREPHKRMESGYRMWASMPWGSPTPHCPFTDLSSFVLKVCADAKGDHHVLPATELANYEGALLPNRIIRWNFLELEELLGIKIAHYHSSNPGPCIWSDAARSAFAERYAPDLEIWHQTATGARTAGFGTTRDPS